MLYWGDQLTLSHCSSWKGMKVETLILSILSRAIQVGLRPIHLEYPKVSLDHSCNVTCDCDCICVPSDRWVSGAVIGFTLGLAVSGWICLAWWWKYGKPQSLLSPRRRGRGYIYHPSGPDPGVLVQWRWCLAWEDCAVASDDTVSSYYLVDSDSRPGHLPWAAELRWWARACKDFVSKAWLSGIGLALVSPLTGLQRNLQMRTWGGWIKEAMDEAKKAHQWDDAKIPSTVINRKGEEVSASAFLGRLLVSRRVTAKGRGVTTPAAIVDDEMAVDYAGDLKDRVRPIRAAPEGYVWVAEESVSGKILGEELDVTPGCGIMIDFDIGLVQIGSQWIRGRKKKVEEVHSFVEELQRRYPSPQLSISPLERVREPALKKDDDAEAENAEEAVSRGCPCAAYWLWRARVRDTSSSQWSFKSERSIASKDWPMEGPLCALHLLKQMHRSGGTPKGLATDLGTVQEYPGEWPDHVWASDLEGRFFGELGAAMTKSMCQRWRPSRRLPVAFW